jgi:hypothetical protein
MRVFLSTLRRGLCPLNDIWDKEFGGKHPVSKDGFLVDTKKTHDLTDEGEERE